MQEGSIPLCLVSFVDYGHMVDPVNNVREQTSIHELSFAGNCFCSEINFSRNNMYSRVAAKINKYVLMTKINEIHVY